MVDPEDPSSSAVPAPSSSAAPAPIFIELLKTALSKPNTSEVPYDETKFNELYKTLVENNDKMKVEVKGKLFGTNKVPIIIKPTDLPGKTALYNLLLIIQNTAPIGEAATDEAKKGAILTQQTQAAAFLILSTS